MFDFESLSMKDVALIEELSGMSISAIADEERPKGKAMAALAMVAKRKANDPKFTFNQALDLTFGEVNALLGFDKDATEEEGKDSDSELSETE